MKHPEFDRDGYPTDRTLKAIEEWDSKKHDSLIEFVNEAWYYPDYITMEGGEIRLCTGGWSGNESLIYAMKQNRMFWLLHWYSSTRGGLHIFDGFNKENIE